MVSSDSAAGRYLQWKEFSIVITKPVVFSDTQKNCLLGYSKELQITTTYTEPKRNWLIILSQFAVHV